MNKSVYFFDERQHLIRIVKESELVEVIQEKEITVNKDELMNDSLTVTTVYDQELKMASYKAVKEARNNYSLYRIIIDSEAENKINFVGVSFAPDELDAYVLNDNKVNESSIKQILNNILKDTEWEIGTVSSGLPLITEDFSFLSIREALKKIQVQGCEVLFTYKIDGIGITKKQINVYKEIGKVSNQRFTYGEKALSIIKEQDRNQIYTSLIGRGRGEDVGDGTGKRIDFASIEWKKDKGNPLDKPKGQNWLEFTEMTELYGIPLKNGGMRKREKVIIFDEDEDPETLLQHTHESLVECSRPLIQFKTTILGGDSIGNRVTIHRHDRNYHYETRIFKVKIDRLTEKVEAGLGDNITRNMSKSAADLKTNVDSLEEKKMTFYDSEEISKWQDDILRGAKGGSIKLMNGLETGKSDSREPYQMVFMNDKTLEKSDNFLVMNSDGIGFVKDKFTNKPKTAWTIDGKFNADYINTGTLRAIDIKGVNIYGSTFESDSGGFKVQILNGKIRFLNSDTDKEIGAIAPAFSDGNLKGYTIIQKSGYSINLGTQSRDAKHHANVISIPPESTADAPKLNLFGDININGRLFLNGREISGNGSGGGGMPSELTTEQEKNAWAIWQYFKARNWTEQSIAGMLGNMESESNIMPDIDELSGGGGYGLTQWTPKAKLMNWCKERSLDHRLLDSQCQRLQWEMENNQQWFYNPMRPDISYLSFRDFTKLTDVKHAAECFIALYEHPGNPNQPNRAIQAQYWYEKLRNVNTTKTTGSKGLDHLESLYKQRLGNGQCYAVSAEYSGVLGGCGLGSGTGYPISHNIGNTIAAADIGSAYNWAAVGWKVIYNPSYNQLVTGAIINWKRGGDIGGFKAHNEYGHTGVIRGVVNGGFQTYEQNIGLGQVVGKYERPWVNSSEISSIVIPPN